MRWPAVLVLWLCCCKAAARQFTTSDRLISNTVYAACRDSRGYMWFGTDKGVVRYDGHSFKNYTLLDGLGDNDIFNFYEDKQQRLWLFSFNGTHCFIRNDSVFNASNDTLLKKMPVFSTQLCMLSTGDSTLYIGCRSGPILKVHGMDIDTITVPFFKAGNLTLLYMSGDTLKAVSKEEIISMMGKRVVKRERFSAGPSIMLKDTIYAPDIKGLKVYHKRKIIRQYDDKRLNWDNMLQLYMNEEGDLFCCTYDGLWRIDHQVQKPQVVLKNLKVTRVAQDVSGNYWVTTIGNGIYRLNAAFAEMRTLSDVNYDKIFYWGNGQIFFTKNDQLFVYTTATGGMTRLPIRFRGGIEPLYYAPGLLLYRHYAFRSISMDTKSGLGKNIFPAYSFLKNVYECDSNRLIMTITSTDKYRLWNVIRDGSRIRILDSIFFRERITAAQYHPASKCLYVLTRRGLYAYQVDNYKLSRLDTFTDTQPLDLFLVGDYIAVPASDRSLMVYLPGNSRYRRRIITDLAIYASYRLRNGRYLVKSSKGFLLSDPVRSQDMLPAFKTIEYPFKSSEIVELYPLGDSVLCNVDNQLFLFDQNLLNRKLHRPELFIGQVTINGRAYPKGDLVVKNLAACNVELTLGALYFNNAEHHYQYRVESREDTTQWYNSGTNKISLLLSKYGTYHIYVRSVSENGGISVVRVVNIRLLPPFYHTWWFALCELLAAAGIVVYVIYWYNKRRQKRYEQELNYMQLEYRSVNSLLNPHFIFNAINNIQGLISDHQGEKANEYLHLLSRLIRQNIENLQFTLIPLRKELELIGHYIYLQNLRFDNRISYVVHNNLPQDDDIKVPPLLIHNFIENALVHGYSNEISSFRIMLELDLSTDDYLIIKVTDNGLGYHHPKAAASLTDKTSLGIDSIGQRIQRLSAFHKLNYSLDIIDLETRGGKGTEVLLILYARLSRLIA